MKRYAKVAVYSKFRRMLNFEKELLNIWTTEQWKNGDIYHLLFTKFSLGNSYFPSELQNDWCFLKLLIVWESSMTAPIGLQMFLSFLENIKSNKLFILCITKQQCNTWMIIAAFVCTLYLNSIRATIDRKPVCKTTVDNLILM